MICSFLPFEMNRNRKTYCRICPASEHYCNLFTGRNEVLAKVIFSQASVILFPGGSGPGGVSGPGGFLQIFGGEGSPNFRGGLQFFGGVPPIFRGGGVSKFSGVSNFLGVSKFSGGVPRHWNMVNVRPVRILLECILVGSNLLTTFPDLLSACQFSSSDA